MLPANRFQDLQGLVVEPKDWYYKYRHLGEVHDLKFTCLAMQAWMESGMFDYYKPWCLCHDIYMGQGQHVGLYVRI